MSFSSSNCNGGHFSIAVLGEGMLCIHGEIAGVLVVRGWDKQPLADKVGYLTNVPNSTIKEECIRQCHGHTLSVNSAN